VELLVAGEDKLFNGRAKSTVPGPSSGPTIRVTVNTHGALMGYETSFEIKIILKKKFQVESLVNA
jgi:hypothetical protein